MSDSPLRFGPYRVKRESGAWLVVDTREGRRVAVVPFGERQTSQEAFQIAIATARDLEEATRAI